MAPGMLTSTLGYALGTVAGVALGKLLLIHM
jgi:hypothetical protein